MSKKEVFGKKWQLLEKDKEKKMQTNAQENRVFGVGGGKEGILLKGIFVDSLCLEKCHVIFCFFFFIES